MRALSLLLAAVAGVPTATAYRAQSGGGAGAFRRAPAGQLPWDDAQRAPPPPAHEGAARAGALPVDARAGILGGGAPSLDSLVSVADFGAVGDGVTDNTAAFQAAIDSLRGGGGGGTPGGIVWVPAGRYAFDGSLALPPATSLVGTYLAPPSHPVGQRGGLPPTDGSVLMPRGGRGNESGDPFISLGDDCTLRGVVIYYPDQLPAGPPVPYPWAVSMANATNPAVLDVELLNPWNGVYAVGAPRHYVARVYGQPANIGVFVDRTYDIGRIENVHFNPWFSAQQSYVGWQSVNGRGFVFARTDWEYVANTFVFGMAVGYDFVASAEGACNGNFAGIGADACQNASVRVSAADPWGILISNGEFTSFTGGFGPDVADHTRECEGGEGEGRGGGTVWGDRRQLARRRPPQHPRPVRHTTSAEVVVTATNTGAVRFTNCAFWGPSNQIAHINGTGAGSVGFASCLFNAWDAVGQNRSAIQVYGGNVLVRGCEFQGGGRGKPQVLLAAGAGKAVVTDNIVDGPLGVVNQGARGAVVVNNLGDD